MSYKDYYRVLGVARDASADEIQRTYRQLARKYHPDVSKEPNAEERFKEITGAYEVLRDPEKRKLYDRYGEQWKAISEGRAAPGPNNDQVRFDFGQAGFDFADLGDLGDLGSIFETFFGPDAQGAGFVGTPMGGSPFARRARRSGSSARPDFDPFDRGGDRQTKLALSVRDAFEGGSHMIQLAGESGRPKQLRVKIPAGVRTGQRIRLGGQGGMDPSGAARDLYLEVEVRDDEDFRLDGDDVYTPLPISPWEAALGVKATLPTLEGDVRLTVPAGTTAGRKIRLRAKGYPRSKGGRGDLFAVIRIEVPAEFTAEERELMEKLAGTSTFCPRAKDRR